jgi:hypothetical protein
MLGQSLAGYIHGAKYGASGRVGSPLRSVLAKCGPERDLSDMKGFRMLLDWDYLTFRKTMAKVYRAIDSISTSAKIRAKRIAAAAPGFRASPSQAAAVALAWA